MVLVPKINRIIRILVTTDVIIYGSWGLFSPIYAVFIIESITVNGDKADEAVVGLAVGIFWVVKSLLQFPIGRYLDVNHGEKDDFWFMVIGTFLASLIPIGFLFAKEAWHLYALEAFHGAAMAMVIPAWGGIFTRHMDKGLEAETWGLESSSLGLGTGLAGIAGGFIAKAVGFPPLLIAVSAIGVFGSLVLLTIRKDILPRKGGVIPLKKEHIK